ncbi:MAG TPA: magnesium/cobalt transporter CorA [Saprospiraceae bacterium]|nr:magnesium/cobalt transporter CorA [Saprospiraceae bacterium]
MSRKFRSNTKIRKKGLPPGTLVYTGYRTDKPSTVFTVQIVDDQYREQPYYSPDQRKSKGLVWVDIRSLTETALISRIGDDFRMHPLAQEDVLDTQQRAKMEEFDNGLFVILPSLNFKKETREIVSEQISIFFGKDFLLSFQEDPDDDFAPVRLRALEGIGRLRKKGSDYLAYALMDTIIDGYYEVLDDIQEHLFELEETLHRNGAEPEVKAGIFDLKRAVNEFRFKVLPLRDAATRLYRTESDLVEESNRLYIRDVVDHVAQILDGIDNEGNMLSGLESLYHAEASNRLNNVMRLLTVISTIFIPLSFVAGVYGMNFDNMPELHTRYGYFMVLGGMFVAMVGMLAYFRKKRWI